LNAETNHKQERKRYELTSKQIRIIHWEKRFDHPYCGFLLDHLQHPALPPRGNCHSRAASKGASS
jgi:hypothetical protein